MRERRSRYGDAIERNGYVLEEVVCIGGMVDKECLRC